MEKERLPEATYSSAGVLIAGVANFLGYHLAESLLISDIQVIGLDNLITGSDDLVQELYSYPKFSFFKADINQPLPAALFREDISHVVHLANIETCSNQGHLQLNELLTNSFGVKNLLDYSLDKKAPFVFASSIDIYQGLASSTSLSRYYDGEAAESKLTYAESKRYAESLCQEYAQVYNLDARVARLSEVYGPKMRLDGGTPFAAFLSRALTGQELVVSVGGTSQYILTYVSDAVYGLVKLIFAPANVAKQGIFYFVNPQEHALVDVAHIVARLAQKEEGATPLKVRLDADKKGVSLGASRIDLTRSQRDLYWEAKVGLEEGLRQTLDYFQSNPELVQAQVAQEPKFDLDAALSSEYAKGVPKKKPEEKDKGVEKGETPKVIPTGTLTSDQRKTLQYQAVKDTVEERLEQPEISEAKESKKTPSTV